MNESLRGMSLTQVPNPWKWSYMKEGKSGSHSSNFVCLRVRLWVRPNDPPQEGDQLGNGICMVRPRPHEKWKGEGRNVGTVWIKLDRVTTGQMWWSPPGWNNNQWQVMVYSFSARWVGDGASDTNSSEGPSKWESDWDLYAGNTKTGSKSGGETSFL